MEAFESIGMEENACNQNFLFSQNIFHKYQSLTYNLNLT